MQRAICYRNSVCLFVRRVDHRKTVKVKIMKFLAYGSSIPLVLRGKFHPAILKGSPNGGVKQGSGG